MVPHICVTSGITVHQLTLVMRLDRYFSIPYDFYAAAQIDD